MPKINFLMTTPVTERDYLATGLEILKRHGVIKRFSEVVEGTKFQFTNVSAFKSGTVTYAPKGFMTHFRKKYCKQIESLKDVPVQDDTKPKRDYRDFESLQAENARLKELLALKEALLASKEEQIRDKQMIIELMRGKN